MFFLYILCLLSTGNKESFLNYLHCYKKDMGGPGIGSLLKIIEKVFSIEI